MPGGRGPNKDTSSASRGRRHLLKSRFPKPSLLGSNDRFPKLDDSIEQNALWRQHFFAHIACQLVEFASGTVERCRFLTRIGGSQKGKHLLAHIPQGFECLDRFWAQT